MIDQDTYNRIAYLADESIEDTFYAISEEVGELALPLHVRNKTKIRDLKEPAEAEAVDVILCAIEMLVKLGVGPEEINKIAKAKLDKWEKSVMARRAKERNDKLDKVLRSVSSFSIQTEKKQDAWLVEQGYIERQYYRFINFLIEVTCEITLYDDTKQDGWLARGGYV
jgi:hypothetical protein